MTLRSEREILETARLYRSKGLQPPPLSAEEKARAFGDPTLDGLDSHAGVAGNDLRGFVRIDDGLPMPKGETRRLRRLRKDLLRGDDFINPRALGTLEELLNAGKLEDLKKFSVSEGA